MGRTMSYPTINLDPAVLPTTTQVGVYAALVKIAAATPTTSPSPPKPQPALHQPSATLAGALFFGPRLVFGETHNVLEIYLLDFSQQVYNQSASFKLMEFIREPRDFTSLSELQQQIQSDVERVQKALQLAVSTTHI